MKMLHKEPIKLPKDLIQGNSVLSGFRGSISHNTFKPSSIDDIDLISIYLAPVDYYIGLNQKKSFVRGNQILQDEFDLVSYELRHFVKLALKFNPNIIPLLWLNKDHYINIDAMGELFITNRDYFSSKHAYKTFTGYAMAQLARMSKKSFEGYMGEKRKALVKKFGYDCKNASHAIRLFKMGIEFLDTGKLNVYRDGDDRELLMDIKEGGWELDDLQGYAKYLYAEAKESLKNSDLPEEPDYKGVNRIFMEVISDYVYDKYQMPRALMRY